MSRSKEKSAARLPWTSAEIATLHREWHERGPRGLVRALPGRTYMAIYQRAQSEGLPLGAPQGCVSLRAAALRLGVHADTLLKMLRAAQVQIRTNYPRPGAGKGPPASRTPHRNIEWDDARDAFDLWMATETVNGAAARLDIPSNTLNRWLLAAGVIEKCGRGAGRRVLSEIIDRVVAERRPAPTARAA